MVDNVKQGKYFIKICRLESDGSAHIITKKLKVIMVRIFFNKFS